MINLFGKDQFFFIFEKQYRKTNFLIDTYSNKTIIGDKMEEDIKISKPESSKPKKKRKKLFLMLFQLMLISLVNLMVVQLLILIEIHLELMLVH